MSITVYGIPNCDTVKKARQWLAERGIAYRFHDYKKDGADPARVAGWVEKAGWERVLNRSGTTFRKLPEADKDAIDAEKAVALMVANPSAIRRPIVEHPDGMLIGFNADGWGAALR